MFRVTAAAAALLVLCTPAFAGLFDIQERGWLVNLEVSRPRDAWNERNRDITLMTLSGVRSWEFGYGFEAQAGAGLFIANGTRRELDTAPVDSDAYGITFGGGLRWYAFALRGMRPFVQGQASAAYTPANPFPAGGSAINGYVRAGGGVRIDISDRYAAEAGYQLSHVSNGGGLVPGNPAYNGHGLFLNLRWRG